MFNRCGLIPKFFNFGSSIRAYSTVGNGVFIAFDNNEIAIFQLFAELGVEPIIEDKGNFKRYSAEHIVVFVGDIFNLSAQDLGSIDAVYDRAAMVALPESMRFAYTKHLKALTDNAKLLLLCFVYEQSLMNGPPFSIDKNEVEKHYGDSHVLNHLSTAAVSGGFKNVSAHEWVWLLN